MSGMLLMTIVACVVGLALGATLVWYLLARGSHAVTVQETDFDDAYDELVADGDITDPDRKRAWQDFDSWQVTNERERLRWEEAADE
ncbi:MAG: hypothetical protein ACXWA9_11005 [Acidimicrobiia bacterium]